MCVCTDIQIPNDPADKDILTEPLGHMKAVPPFNSKSDLNAHGIGVSASHADESGSHFDCQLMDHSCSYALESVNVNTYNEMFQL